MSAPSARCWSTRSPPWVGESASSFSLAPVQAALPQPRVAVSAPSTLLQRRPDIAAAERRAAAANADIGVARAAYFPTLTLDGSAGWQNAGAGSLLAAPNTFWMVGPQLVGAIFDGGRRKAGVQASRAAFDQASANYRSVVLSAFRDVEDQMALANRLAAEAKDQDDAVTAARRTEELANIRYKQGRGDLPRRGDRPDRGPDRRAGRDPAHHPAPAGQRRPDPGAWRRVELRPGVSPHGH